MQNMERFLGYICIWICFAHGCLGKDDELGSECVFVSFNFVAYSHSDSLWRLFAVHNFCVLIPHSRQTTINLAPSLDPPKISTWASDSFDRNRRTCAPARWQLRCPEQFLRSGWPANHICIYTGSQWTYTIAWIVF